MKIMSFNTQHCLNYLEQKIDYEIMAAAISSQGADIVGLNEMHDDGEGAVYGSQVKMLSQLTGLKYYYFAKAIDDVKGPYGNAILSKYKIINASTITIPDPYPKKYKDCYETRCILKAELENGYTIFVTHFGLNPDEQENAVKTILEILKDEKCILMGDFNVAPSSELLVPLRERMMDTAEAFNENKLSFPSDNPTIKIDYIFISKDITLKDADIPSIIASDHRPHTATIE